MEGLDIWGIISIAAGSSVVAALTTEILGWVKDLRAKAGDRRAVAEVDAIFLIRDLDALAVSCANAIWEHEEVFAQLEGRPEQRDYPGCVRPELTVSKEALSKIDKHIAAKLAWLENELKLGQDQIKSAWWHDALDFNQAHDQQACLVGYFGAKALEVSGELRALYGLNSEQYKWGMNGVEELLIQMSKSSKKYLKKQG